MKPSTPIGLFIAIVAFIEVGLGIAVQGAPERFQGSLILFMCVFAVIAFVTFVCVLLLKPHALYPPSEFSGGASFQDYVNAAQKPSKLAVANSGSKIKGQGSRAPEEPGKLESGPGEELAAVIMTRLRNMGYLPTPMVTLCVVLAESYDMISLLDTFKQLEATGQIEILRLKEVDPDLPWTSVPLYSLFLRSLAV